MTLVKTVLPGIYKLCKCCSLYCIEDELLFLLVCESYTVIRFTCLPIYNCEYPTVFKVKLLMSSGNPNIIRSVATYLYYAFQKCN